MISTSPIALIKAIFHRDNYYVWEDGKWMHRTPIKVICNPVLRRVQWWTNQPYVIASETEFVHSSPKFKQYTIKRVKQL